MLKIYNSIKGKGAVRDIRLKAGQELISPRSSTHIISFIIRGLNTIGVELSKKKCYNQL